MFAAAAAAVTLPLLLTGCWNGFNAQTSIQQPSGDGLQTQIGNMQIRAAVWVRDAENPRTMTLSATFVNTGKTADELTAVTTSPKAFVVGLTGGTIELPPVSETRTAYQSEYFVNAYGLDVPPSGYVTTTFVFKNAGSVTGSVMTVPPEGIYAGIAPSTPPQPRASGSATPTPTTSPTASTAPRRTPSPAAS